MEVGTSNDSYVGTVLTQAFHLRTNDIPRFSLNSAGQCTLFPEIIGGQKLKLSGFSGVVNGNKGIEVVSSTGTVRLEAGSSNDSYVGTATGHDFHLRRGNTDVLSLRNGYTELNDNNKLRFKEATVNGTSYVELKGPAALAGNVSLTLPATTGTANQVLKTDGSGNMSWIDLYGTPSTANHLQKRNATGQLVDSVFLDAGSKVTTTQKVGIGNVPATLPGFLSVYDNSSSYQLVLGYSPTPGGGGLGQDQRSQLGCNQYGNLEFKTGYGQYFFKADSSPGQAFQISLLDGAAHLSSTGPTTSEHRLRFSCGGSNFLDMQYGVGTMFQQNIGFFGKIPVSQASYIASPTLTQIRDILISYGLMASV
jgi:hypothetical protein